MARLWLDADLTQVYLPALRKLQDNARGRRGAAELLKQMRDDWAEGHGLKTLIQQQGCMDQVRRTIRDQLGEHWSLEVIRFSTEQYTEMNDLKQDSVAKRNESIGYIDQPQLIVDRAVRLLELPEWAAIAAGLAVLTGRRVSELLTTAEFEKQSQWSVMFRGAAKRGSEQGLEFEIPTLTTADRVCAGLAKLRRELPQAAGLSPKELNQRYEPAVAKVCDESFSDLVPVREGESNLYSHLFRAVYATIASFWYCPPAVNVTEFRAAIQGHYQILGETNGKLRRSLAASRHYADFEIAESVIAQHHGKTKGIKLGYGGVEVIEMFKAAATKGIRKPAKGKKKTPSSVRIWKEDRELLERILDHLGLDGEGKQEDRLRTMLEWVEVNLLVATPSPALSPQATELETTEPTEPIEPAPGVPAQEASSLDPLRADLQALTATLKELLVPVLNLQLAAPLPPAPAQLGPAEQPHLAPATTQTAPQPPAPPKTQRKNLVKAQSLLRVNQAIDAIFAHNNAPGRLHDEKWAVTINALKAWVSSAPTIDEVLELRKEQINEHHRQHQIDPAKHNYKHRRKRAIEEVIQLQKVEEE